MKLPNKVRVGYRDIDVIELDHQSNADGTKQLGWYRPVRGLIEVCVEGCKKQDVANTLLHEILHAFWDVGGLKDPTDEETAVTILANTMLQFMRDEPNVVRALIAASKGK